LAQGTHVQRAALTELRRGAEIDWWL